MAKYQSSLTAVHKDMAFSKKDVWIYAALPALPYEFLEGSQREGIAESLSIGLESLLPSQEKALESFLYVTSMPFDAAAWREQLAERTGMYDASPYWPQAMNDMARYLERSHFRSREVYLSIKLGDRREYHASSVFASFRAFSDYLMQYSGGGDPSISESELEFWEGRARSFRNKLIGGALRAEHISDDQLVRSETIVRLLKETLWPGMDMEDIPQRDRQQWGHGEINGLAIADIKNHSRYLKISQFQNGQMIEGYRATLCFSRFPDEYDFPAQEPWIHYSSLLGMPTTIFSRFTIEPARKVRKVVEAKEKDALDQYENSQGSAPLQVLEQLETARQLKHNLDRERRPGVNARHRIVVTAHSVSELEQRVQRVIDHYKNLDIDVVWPTGDQMNLLLESQPADRVRSKAYLQSQEIGIIPVGMPSASGKVGDRVSLSPTGKPVGWLGPYIGHTNSRVREPVFVSMHAAIAKNRPASCAIIGPTGRGKTFLGLTLTYLMALQGTWTVLIDPKGDALPMIDLPGLKGRSRALDLRNGNDGLVDPFFLSDKKEEQSIMALEVIELFLGGGDTIEVVAKNALSEVIKDVANQPEPSLHKVVERLLSHPSPEGKGIGNRLDLIRDLPYAKLCFSPNRNPDDKALKAEDGLTVVSLKGLDLPSNSNRADYSYTNHLAVGIMYLLTRYTEEMMWSSNQKYPKAVVIDEAWSITSTPQGARLIPRLARMGRSLNTATLLISQNARDFINGDIDNQLGYRISFGSKSTQEIEDIGRFLGLETGPDGKILPGNHKTLHDLKTGRCLMRDPEGRIQSVVIDNEWNLEIFDAINTNPDTKIDRR